MVVLILFGAKKLPELAKGLGQGIKEFKRATRDVQDDLHRAIEDHPDPEPVRKAQAPVPGVEATTSSRKGGEGA